MMMMTSLTVPPAYPLVPETDEAAIIDYVVPAWREALEMHATRYRRDDLIASLEAYVRRGYDETQWAVNEAKKDDFVDFVLRRLYRNMINAGEMPDAALRTYGLSPERKRKTGPRSDYVTWTRKIGLTIMVVWVSEVFNLNPTRELENRHRLPPSGCSVMKGVMDRCGDHKSESNIQNNIYLKIIRVWDAEPGGLRRHMSNFLDRLQNW